MSLRRFHIDKLNLLAICIFIININGMSSSWTDKRLLPIKCKPHEFSCHNHKGRLACMPILFKCDGKVDCLNLSDEQDCNERSINCTADEFQCKHRKMCINKKFRCDGTRGDCSDFSDEEGCPNKCDSNTKTMCFDRQICIENELFCDGIADCINGFDEFNCARRHKNYGRGTGLQCPENMFKCRNGLQCIQPDLVCNGASDCDDSSDEFQCEQARLCKPNDKICSNGICRPESDFCNGVEDCSDGSDEENCPKTSFILRDEECEEKEYKCDGRPTICIPYDQLCRTKEARDDCIRRSACRDDHKFCDEKDPNCHCRFTHFNTTICYCPEGFKTVGEKCVDINECDIPGTCDQICTNHIGSFSCSCHNGGYQLYAAKGEGIARKCRVLGSRPLLLLSNRFEMRQYDMITHRYHPLATNLSSDAVLDFWYANQTLLWSDSTNGQMIACLTTTNEDGMLNNLGKCVREGNSEEIDLNDKNSARFHGLAVDWIHGLAFWTEISPVPMIKTYDLVNGYYMTIIDSGMELPKSIVVDPSVGLIFWSDWSNNPRIERAGMNGKDRMKILQQPTIKWPAALTIDILERQLYWADIRLHSIFTSDYYGQNVRQILHSHQYIRHPFSMVVFEDRIYLSDRDQANILSMDRFDGSDVEILFTRLQGPTALRVYQEQLQPTQRNLCENHTCSQLCLPMASMRALSPEQEKGDISDRTTFMCFCSFGYKLDSNDPKKCVHITEASDDIPSSSSDKLRQRRSFFSTLSIMAMICLVLGAVYYWFVNRKTQYSHVVELENPAFDTQNYM